MSRETKVDRSINLQEAMMNKQITCVPMQSCHPPKQASFNKAQRFKMFNNGRIEDEMVKSESFTYNGFTPKSMKDISSKKIDVLKQWETLREQEQMMKRGKENHISERQSINSFALRVKPSWLEKDKQVLRFRLFSEEEIQKPTKELYRVRKFTLHFFLADSKIEIFEDKEENSGIVQGCYLKKILLKKGNNEIFCENDFRVGEPITLLGRKFFCYSCDEFTRHFYQVNNIELKPNSQYPIDDYHKQMKERKKFEVKAKQIQLKEAKLAKRQDTLKQFLDNNGKVLRFFCVWNDNRQYGLISKYELHYFLSDDTIEIRNVDCGKDGKETFPLLLKRQKLVKNINDNNDGHYYAQDLMCGQFIDVLTRKMLLETCDNFTKEFYDSEFQIKQPTVLIPKESLNKRRQMMKSLPPYNGFGSEKDSLANCLHLIPKPVKQDLKRFLKNRGKKLQFVAKFKEPKVEDKDRKFVITYYMDDDSCGVFEPAKNSPGFMGGKFLERGQYKKPVQRINRRRILSRDIMKLQGIVQEKIKSKMNGGPFGLLRAFRQFAINENCMIDLEGFQVGLRSVGILHQTASEALMKELFTIYDKTGDGQIDFQEFVDNVMGDRVVPVNESEFSSRALRASDFFIGAKIQFLFPQTGACSPPFQLLKATKQTLRLMESTEHSLDFPKSNVEIILKNLASTLREFNINVGRLFKNLDVNNQGYIPVNKFGELLSSWAVEFGFTEDSEGLSNHEIITLTRIFDTQSDGKIDFNEFKRALTDRVEAVAELEEKANFQERAAKDALLYCLTNTLETVHRKFDRLPLIHKFLAHCKTHPSGIPKDLFIFFLRDEIGSEIPFELEIQLMLRFDQDCDGKISLKDFEDTLYLTKDGNVTERSAKEVLVLNSAQVKLNKPGFPQYLTLLKRAQVHTFADAITLEKLIKAFVAFFYKRRKQLMKSLLTYDIHRTGVIEQKYFLLVLEKINSEFPTSMAKKLYSFVFKQRKTLDYDQFLTLMFSQKVKDIVKYFGEWN